MVSQFDLKPDIPCRAVVDQLDAVVGGGAWQFRVAVAAAPWWPKQIRAVYFITAASDTLAALEGIRRFVEEAKQPAPAIVLTG